MVDSKEMVAGLLVDKRNIRHIYHTDGCKKIKRKKLQNK
jgi:hypothetical protein